MTYVDGFLLAVPAANKQAYVAVAEKAAPVFRENGAIRVVECWGDDVPEGKLTDFRMATRAEDGEVVVFSWVEWPSREVRDAAHPRIMADPRMQPENDGPSPLDGKRMVFGGFVPVLDA